MQAQSLIDLTRSLAIATGGSLEVRQEGSNMVYALQVRARFSFEQEEESEEAQSTTPRRGGQRFRNLELNASKSVFRTVVSEESMPQADLVRTEEEEKVPVNHTVSLAFAEDRTPPRTRRSILLVND